MADQEKRTLSDKFMLRLPDGMRDRIKSAAEKRHRSMNSEILAALEDWLDRMEYDEYMLKVYEETDPPEAPKPGDIVDGRTFTSEEDQSDNHFDIIRSPEDIEREIRRISEETERRVRAAMLKMLNMPGNKSPHE
jgi:hypothetical protein